jgi:hypothetical protein
LNKRAELKLLEEERIQIQTWRKSNYQLEEWEEEFEARQSSNSLGGKSNCKQHL